MSWTEASFIVDAKLVEPLSDVLESFLALAITSENAGPDEYYEIAFPGTPDWQKVKLTALFDESIELDPIVGFIQKRFIAESSSEIPVVVNKVDDQDWQRIWLDSFKPIQVGVDLWVCPSWCEPPEPQARNIILDPGLAFGTGTHATTGLCLQWLSEQNLSTQTVLDFGSGSGILAIAAIMAGATQADTTDIDPLAIDACLENAARNGVREKLTACLPNELAADQYPLVIANILADVIIELKDTLLLHLASGGTLLLTGILKSQSERVRQAFSEVYFDERIEGDWCMLIGSERKQNS